MKKNWFISLIFISAGLFAQQGNNNLGIVNSGNKTEFSNVFLSKSKEVKPTTLDIYSTSYFYDIPQVIHDIYPNPVKAGDYFVITPIELGETVKIYEPTGVLVQTTVVDIDKRIPTLELKKGDYLVKTKTANLDLIVQ